MNDRALGDKRHASHNVRLMVYYSAFKALANIDGLALIITGIS